jgi:type IV pilus assembly protein PilQ
MLSAPPRILVDLPEVTFKERFPPIAVHNELVSEVSLGMVGDAKAPSMARVTIGLLGEADYEVLPGGDSVIVEVRPRASTGSEPATGKAEPPRVEPAPATPAPTAPKTDLAAADAKSSEPKAPEAQPPKPSGATASPTKGSVSRVLRIVPAGEWVEIQADGPLDNVDAFALHDPERLVVDLWGAENREPRQTISAENALVRKVRVGQHKDKVRVVLDLAAPMGSHTIEPVEGGVRIHLHEQGAAAADGEKGTGSSPAAPAEEALDPSTAPAEPAAEESAAGAGMEAGPARVASVHFESTDEVDRVVVSLNHRVQPLVADPDPSTVVVDLPGTTISREVERRVDTREFGGPVQLISAFQTPDVEQDQVRVVVKRSGSAAPRLQWNGAALMVEFERGPGSRRPAPGPEGPSEPGLEPPYAPPAVTPPYAPPAAIPAAQIMPEQGLGDEAEMYAGPSEPASIDILREGGFTEEKEYQGRRISLDFKDADIGNILRLIADVSDLNIIAGEEVEGTVTVRLVEVPWDQALDVILMTKGLGFTRIGKVLRIAPLEILKQEEEQRLQERRSRERLEDLVVKLQPVSYANAKDLEKLVKRLLSARGTVNIDKRTNTLILKDIPSVINEATALIKAIDTQTPQVLIEAKIVEANLSFSRSLGAVFGIGYNPTGVDGSGNARTWQGGAPDFHLGDGSNLVVPGVGTSPQRSNFVVANPISAATGLLTMGLLGVNDHVQLDLQIQAAEANTKAKVISSPRVVTLDNSEAKILQGTAIKFVASDGDNVSTNFVDAVLELKVTPHITADRTIIMAIRVSRNAPRIDTSTGQDTGINKNEADTEMLVFDGQTAVLGGIYVVEKSDSSSKVPFLADLPLLGPAFRNKSVLDERRELLIFVTPRIVRGMTPAT